MASGKTASCEELLKRIQSLEKENQKLFQLAEKRQEEFDTLSKMTRRIADNAPDLIWAKDMDNRYLFANRALCARLLMCKSTEAVVGKNDVYFAELERSNGQRHTFGEVCENSDEVVKTKKKAMRFVEDGLVRGQYLVLDVHKAPLLDENGKLLGTVGCGRDITREREIQKDLAESRVKPATDNGYRFRLCCFSAADQTAAPPEAERNLCQPIGQGYCRHKEPTTIGSVVPGPSG